MGVNAVLDNSIRVMEIVLNNEKTNEKVEGTSDK